MKYKVTFMNSGGTYSWKIFKNVNRIEENNNSIFLIVCAKLDYKEFVMLKNQLNFIIKRIYVSLVLALTIRMSSRQKYYSKHLRVHE